jgi:hypothetical protein
MVNLSAIQQLLWPYTYFGEVIITLCERASVLRYPSSAGASGLIEWALVVPWITRENILLMFLVYRWRSVCSRMLPTSKRDAALALSFFNLGAKQCCHLAVKI